MYNEYFEPIEDKRPVMSAMGNEGFSVQLDENRKVSGLPTNEGGVYFVFDSFGIKTYLCLSMDSFDAMCAIGKDIEKKYLMKSLRDRFYSMVYEVAVSLKTPSEEG